MTYDSEPARYFLSESDGGYRLRGPKIGKDEGIFLSHYELARPVLHGLHEDPVNDAVIFLEGKGLEKRLFKELERQRPQKNELSPFEAYLSRG